MEFVSDCLKALSNQDVVLVFVDCLTKKAHFLPFKITFSMGKIIPFHALERIQSFCLQFYAIRFLSTSTRSLLTLHVENFWVIFLVLTNLEICERVHY